MSGLEVVAIAGCIAALCSAYADGTELVAKIKERRRARRALRNTTAQDDSTQNLELSLQTNRTVIKNHYDREIGRLGSMFAEGDREARETLKDIIIDLQRQVISNLKIAAADDTYVDFLPLQDVADGSGDRAIDCLRQLHDRLAPLRGAHRPLARMAIQAPRGLAEPFHGFVEPVLSRDSTWETTKPVPTPSAKRTGSSDEGKKQRRMLPLFKSRPKSDEAVQQQQQNRTADATSAYPEEFLATNVRKEQAQDPSPLLTDLHIRAKRKTNISRVGSTSTTQSQTFEPDHPEFNAWADAQSPHESHRSSKASSSSQAYPPTPESADNRHSSGPHPLQIIHSSPSRDSYWSQGSPRDSHGSFGSAVFPNTGSIQAPIVKPNELPKGTPGDYFPLLQAQMALSPAPASNHQHHLSSIDRHAGHMSDGKSLLPGEHNKYAGFCKGAWRMQIGERKKALDKCQKPGAMLSSMPYWRCSAKNCHFEGKMPLDKYGKVMLDKQGNKAIDMRVLSSNNIYLRWSFLFKSHIHVNRDLEDPSKATFGCIFCCAEGRVAPMFGGLQMFMEHLQIHRQRPPQGEVLYRINCIVGRNPQPGEEFDIVLA